MSPSGDTRCRILHGQVRRFMCPNRLGRISCSLNGLETALGSGKLLANRVLWAATAGQSAARLVMCALATMHTALVTHYSAARYTVVARHSMCRGRGVKTCLRRKEETVRR